MKCAMATKLAKNSFGYNRDTQDFAKPIRRAHFYFVSKNSRPRGATLSQRDRATGARVEQSTNFLTGRKIVTQSQFDECLQKYVKKSAIESTVSRIESPSSKSSMKNSDDAGDARQARAIDP